MLALTRNCLCSGTSQLGVKVIPRCNQFSPIKRPRPQSNLYPFSFFGWRNLHIVQLDEVRQCGYNSILDAAKKTKLAIVDAGTQILCMLQECHPNLFRKQVLMSQEVFLMNRIGRPKPRFVIVNHNAARFCKPNQTLT